MIQKVDNIVLSYHFSELIWVVDMFLKLEGETVSAKALKTFNYEAISVEINTLIQAVPEETRPRGKNIKQVFS